MIERVTQEQYDERFYFDQTKVNIRTNTHWFPAYHFLMSTGAPVSPHLVEWWKNMGQEADRILKQKEERGSWVHDKVESMIKVGWKVTQEEIESRWGNYPKDQLFVNRALTGLFNFLNDEQAEIVSSERMIIADDWAGTMDLEVRIKSDDYKNVWIVDIKTAKSVFEEHKQQVEAYRRVTGADRAGILILGNSTKKRYTFSEVQKSKQDYYWKLFQAQKEVAYIILENEKRLEPTNESFPESYSLLNINYVPDKDQVDTTAECATES